MQRDMLAFFSEEGGENAVAVCITRPTGTLFKEEGLAQWTASLNVPYPLSPIPYPLSLIP